MCRVLRAGWRGLSGECCVFKAWRAWAPLAGACQHRACCVQLCTRGAPPACLPTRYHMPTSCCRPAFLSRMPSPLCLVPAADPPRVEGSPLPELGSARPRPRRQYAVLMQVRVCMLGLLCWAGPDLSGPACRRVQAECTADRSRAQNAGGEQLSRGWLLASGLATACCLCPAPAPPHTSPASAAHPTFYALHCTATPPCCRTRARARP